MQKGVDSRFKCWVVGNGSDKPESANRQADGMKRNDYVTAKGMADILKVPVSWIYRNADKCIPCFRVGKYLRFNPQDVVEQLKASSIEKEG